LVSKKRSRGELENPPLRGGEKKGEGGGRNGTREVIEKKSLKTTSGGEDLRINTGGGVI